MSASVYSRPGEHSFKRASERRLEHVRDLHYAAPRIGVGVTRKIKRWIEP